MPGVGVMHNIRSTDVTSYRYLILYKDFCSEQVEF